MTLLPTLAGLAASFATGKSTARIVVDECLLRIAAPEGEGARAFIHVDANRARAEADASDLLRRHGVVASPLAGMPLSIKDLFDVVGQVTQAGSRVLGAESPAVCDAPPIARLRAAGAVFVGRTNMTEFAYSGVGLNSHYGTPANPYDRKTRRIPGGSTSGGAVSVTDGMAAASIGTDTGGSCRIPAALCGLVGFKPTAKRISLKGCVPLSPSLDSVGCMARTVGCVALLDAVMAGEERTPLKPAPLSGLRLLVPQTMVLDRTESLVAEAFDKALRRLSAAGATIVDEKVQVFARLPELAERGGLTAAESYAWHADLIAREGANYDPRVYGRITLGKSLSASDYQRLQALRRTLIGEASNDLESFDAVVMPTVPIVAPAFSEFDNDDDRFTDLNRLLLRNPSIANLLDRCAVTLPCHSEGRAPVGITLMARSGEDLRLLQIASGVEQALQKLY